MIFLVQPRHRRFFGPIARCAGYLGHLFRNRHSENNYPNRLEQIVANNRNI